MQCYDTDRFFNAGVSFAMEGKISLSRICQPQVDIELICFCNGRNQLTIKVRIEGRQLGEATMKSGDKDGEKKESAKETMHDMMLMLLRY